MFFLTVLFKNVTVNALEIVPPDKGRTIFIYIPPAMDQKKKSFIQIKRSSSGLGLFALAPIRKNKTIIEYIGHRVPTSIGNTLDNRYIFSVSSRFDIDGSPRFNTARYINHSCRPNCDAINRRGRIFIVARKNIKEGEELTYNYGKDYFDGYIKKAGCRCEKCFASNKTVNPKD